MRRWVWLLAWGVGAEAACGSVGAGDGLDGSVDGGVDGNGAGLDGAPAPDAGPAVEPGDVRWVRSLSAMYAIGVADGASGVSVSGSITGPVDLGGGPLVPRSASDLVVAGLNASDASYVYAVRHGTAGNGSAFGFLDHTDPQGNPILYGVCAGPVDLGLGPIADEGTGTDGFVGRYGPNAPGWVLRAVGPGEDKLLATAPAPNGKLYVGGWFADSTTVSGQHFISKGGRDLLFTRLNAFTGAPDFVRTFGGTGRDEISGAAGDGTSVILGGFFDDTLPLGANVSVTAAGGGLDLWVAKLDASADPVWAVSFGGAGEDRGTTVAIDEHGDVYLAASFENQLAVGTIQLSSKGKHDIVVAKLHGGDGSVAWAQSIGTTGDDGAYKLIADGHGHVVLAAQVGGALDGGPSDTGTDALVVSLDSEAGATRWRKLIATSGFDYAQSVAPAVSGDVLALIGLGGAFDFGLPLIGAPGPAAVLLKIAP